MLNYSYYPFSKELEQIEGDDLATLKSVAEGWYVDYKQQGLKIADYAKHMAAFANQYGGWLFIGIKENSDGSRTASEFPGLPKSELEKVSTDIREASAAHVNPEILYEERVIEGPIESLGLPEDHSILIIGVPMSYSTPHIHSSGRIYRRLADQSKPKEETDRYILDELWKRGNLHKEKTSSFLRKVPPLPECQADSPWLHIFFKASQSQLGPLHRLSFDDFSNIVRNKDNAILGVQCPMQSVQTTADGFLARQIEGNDPSLATLTLRWWHDSTVRFDIPLNKHNATGFLETHERNSHAKEFHEIVCDTGYSNISIVDYSIVIQVIASLTNHYLQMLNVIGDTRDSLSCFKLRNVFHTSPFVDSKEFIERAREFAIPMTTDEQISVPKEPDESNMFFHGYKNRDVDFKSYEEYSPVPYTFSVPLFYRILEAVGIVSDVDQFTNDKELWGFDKVNNISASP